jgi:hypothetical protein
VEGAVGEYNKISEDVPYLIKSLFGNEVGQVTVEMNDGSLLYLKIVTEDAKIVEFEEIGADDEIDATLLVTIDENTLENLLKSTSPMNIFLDAYDSGKITIKATGITNQISLTWGNLVIQLSQLVGFI